MQRCFLFLIAANTHSSFPRRRESLVKSIICIVEAGNLLCTLSNIIYQLFHFL